MANAGYLIYDLTPMPFGILTPMPFDFAFWLLAISSTVRPQLPLSSRV